MKSILLQPSFCLLGGSHKKPFTKVSAETTHSNLGPTDASLHGQCRFESFRSFRVCSHSLLLRHQLWRECENGLCPLAAKQYSLLIFPFSKLVRPKNCYQEFRFSSSPPTRDGFLSLTPLAVFRVGNVHEYRWPRPLAVGGTRHPWCRAVISTANQGLGALGRDCRMRLSNRWSAESWQGLLEDA